MKTSQKYMVGALGVLIFTGIFFLTRTHALWVDEKDYYHFTLTLFEQKFHLPWIKSIWFGRFAAFPTYSVILAGIALLFNAASIPAVRLYTFVIAISAVGIFFLAAKKMDPRTAWMKTAQFSFLPVLFPFFFLIYTDMFSLACVLLTAYFALKNRYALAGAAGIFSILARQNNAIWFAFFYLCLALENLSSPWTIKSWIKHVGRGWVFIVGALLFVLFVRWNGGVLCSMSQRNPVRFYTNNLYFVFFALAVIFMPFFLGGVSEWISWLKRPLFWVSGAVLCMVYMRTFVNDNTINRFNELPQYQFDQGMFFLRNRVLTIVFSTPVHKMLFFIPIMIGIMSLTVLKLSRPCYYWIYPFSFLYLGCLWAVEPRYYFISFALIQLYRKSVSPAWEWLLLAYFALLSGLVYYFMYQNIFFLLIEPLKRLDFIPL